MSLDTALDRLDALQARLRALELDTAAADQQERRDALAQCDSLTRTAAALRHRQQRQPAHSVSGQPDATPTPPASSKAAELAAKMAAVRSAGASTTAAQASASEQAERKAALEAKMAAIRSGGAASAPAPAPVARVPSADVELRRRKAVRDMQEGGVLTMYLQSGKKKHDRHFWLENGSTICWDKKKTKPGKANKSGAILSFEPTPATKTAREWFDMIDADGSGELDAEELAELYQKARGEKLKKKELKAAMQEMDKDGGGTIDFEEFESWWRANGGDLETKRALAITIVVEGGVQLLLVAKSSVEKQRWVAGLEAVLATK